MWSEQAARYKTQGNAALSAQKYAEAAELYSKAIALEPSEATYFSNRAAAHAALEQWQQSLDDSYEVVTLRPEWAKGWVRRGSALMGLKKYEEARKAYLKATQLEPGNDQIQQFMDAAEAKAKAAAKAKEKQWENDLWSDDDDDEQPQPKKAKHAGGGGSAAASAGASSKRGGDDDGAMDSSSSAPRRSKSKPGAALLAQLDRSLKDASEDSLRACLGQVASSDADLAERVLHVLEGLNAASSAGEDDDDEERAGLGGADSD